MGRFFSVFAVQRAEKLAIEWISCCSRGMCVPMYCMWAVGGGIALCRASARYMEMSETKEIVGNEIFKSGFDWFLDISRTI